MNIKSACYEEMVDRARRDTPNETCGLFTGRPGTIEGLHPMKNAASQPEVRYEFDSTEHIKAIHKMKREGIPILGIYHSHPASEAYPSATDVDRALWDKTPLFPEYLYIILSLQNPSAPAARAFRILSGGEIREEELTVVMA